MHWPFNPPEDMGLIVSGGAGVRWLLPFWLDRRDKARKAASDAAAKLEKDAADKAVSAQKDAMDNKDREIQGWRERYEQEHRERREDEARYEQRIAALEALLYGQERTR